MSFKLHTTDEAFYDLDFLIRRCDKTDKQLLDALWKARDEYKRLFDHCEHQRDVLRGWDKAWIEDKFLRKHAFLFADDERECHMNSIDNLREWANGLHGVYVNKVDHTITVTTGWDAPPDMDSVNLRDHVNGILDGIEQEVADMRGFCERLDDAATKREDVTLWGVDYTALPVDADGVPIHVGDVMENIVCPPVHREVTGVGVECFYGWDEGNGRYSQFDANCYRHHHAPTVEDVLREFASDIADVLGGDDFRLDDSDELFAEYAAKLRLAGDE